MSKRLKKIMILNAAQREAITQSPARLEVLDAMSEIAPCSVAELARELGRSPQSLYYHMEIMVGVGLLQQSGSRKAGKRDEALYDMVSDHFRLAGSDDTAEEVRSTLLRFNSTVFRLTERNYRAAVTEGLARRVGRRENIYLRRQRGRLSDRDLARFYELLDEMGSLLSATTAASAKRGATGAKPTEESTRSYALTVALVPLDRSDRPEEAAPARSRTSARRKPKRST